MWSRRYYQPILLGHAQRRVEISERSFLQLDLGRLAFLLGMATSSFDLFLTARLGGFQLRPYQVLLAPVLAYAAGQAFRERGMRWPLGAIALLMWVLVIAVFVPNTYLLMRSVGYLAWLIMNMMVVFSAVQLFGQREWMLVMLKWYLASFLGMSVVGL